jgi:hypothetical protein
MLKVTLGIQTPHPPSYGVNKKKVNIVFVKEENNDYGQK